MSDKAEEVYLNLQVAIASDKVILPTLPEIAIKIRDEAEAENSSILTIAAILSQDASLTTRLIQVANSPLYRGNNAIEDIQMAISRLGIKIVKDLVIRLAMKQMYQSTSEVLDRHFRAAWSTSVEVAAISRMLASMTPISNEHALLAGLIHNIGTLPILVFAEEDDELFNDNDALSEVIYSIGGRVGRLILESWKFAPELIDAVSDCYKFNRSHAGDADLTDIIQVSILQGGFAEGLPGTDDWTRIQAFDKLDLDTEVDSINIEENQAMIDEARSSIDL
ncbi:MAG: HDOD domain-containing protein [Gammaproteobacteria bacterium]|nr:HDOD domain-containing protein [Gammaproteobacteria bacterium]